MALQLSLCALGFTLTLVGGRLYVSFHILFQQQLLSDRLFYVMCAYVPGKQYFLTHQQSTVCGAAGQSGVLVILAQKTG